MTDGELWERAQRFADSLTGYISHDANRPRCRHCELAEDLHYELMQVRNQTREEDARIVERSKVGQGLWRVHIAAAIRQGRHEPKERG